MNTIPRRNQLQEYVPAEIAIRNAMAEVEKMGADVRLTDAIFLLEKAKNKVADFVDGIEPSATTDDKREAFNANV